MEERFETFTILIARIRRSIKRIKSEEMADFELKGPHVSCLYYLSLCEGMTAAELCERCDEDRRPSPVRWTIWRKTATSPARAARASATRVPSA